MVAGSKNNNVDNFNDSANHRTQITQRILSSGDIVNFLNGSYSIEGEPVEGIVSRLEVNGSKDFNSLDISSSTDKHYFTLTKSFNFNQLVDGAGTGSKVTDLFNNEST